MMILMIFIMILMIIITIITNLYHSQLCGMAEDDHDHIDDDENGFDDDHHNFILFSIMWYE